MSDPEIADGPGRYEKRFIAIDGFWSRSLLVERRLNVSDFKKWDGVETIDMSDPEEWNNFQKEGRLALPFHDRSVYRYRIPTHRLSPADACVIIEDNHARPSTQKVFTCDLEEADFSSISLHNIIFEECDLRRADFSDAELTKVEFSDCTLEGANFSDVEIAQCQFSGVDLGNTDFNSAGLFFSKLSRVVTEGAVFENATLSDITIKSSFLGPFCDPTITNVGKSIVEEKSLALTIGNIHDDKLLEFLYRTGTPKRVGKATIGAIKDLSPQEFSGLMKNVFIAFGGPDEGFAKWLSDALEDHGVENFFFPYDKIPGQKFHDVSRQVEDYDHVIFLISQESVGRPGFHDEIEKTRERESHEGGSTVAIPAALDDYYFNEFKDDYPKLHKFFHRTASDFRELKQDRDPSHEEFEILLRLLRRDNLDD